MPKIIAAGVGLPLIGTGATVTTSQPLLNLTQTWNNAGVTFTGAKLNVTDTASASASLLMDLQVGGTSKFSVNKFGRVVIGDDLQANSAVSVTNNAGLFKLGASGDVVLARDAANTLALRNGTAAQIFTIYNTYTDASNYERASIGWIGNQFLVTPNSAGTGAGRSMFVGTTNSASVFLGTAGAGRWEVNSSGHFTAVADNAYDIGAVGADRPRTGYFGTSVSVGSGYGWLNNKGSITQAVDGAFTFSNFAGTNSVTATIGASNLLTLNGGLKTTGATFALQTATTLTDNAAAQVATMTNGPTAGNPTKWIAINDNGVTRYLPCW